MNIRYYGITADRKIVILGTRDASEPLNNELLEKLEEFDRDVLTDGDLYKLITEATNALNTTPYAP